MPELQADAPSLRHIGQRLNLAWISQWLAEPESFSVTARCPICSWGTSEVRQQAADVVAYLQSIDMVRIIVTALGIEGNPAQADQAMHRGAVLYEQFSCVVCHTMDMADKLDAFQRHSLAFVSQKFSERATRAGTCRPDEYHLASRMPTSNFPRRKA